MLTFLILRIIDLCKMILDLVVLHLFFMSLIIFLCRTLISWIVWSWICCLCTLSFPRILDLMIVSYILVDSSLFPFENVVSL